jgi:MATE family multidrug resistance protein
MKLTQLKKIILLSLPIIGGMISQNLLNLVDTAMVGQLGAVALSAVGVASFAVFMSQSLVLGLSSGVQAIAARRFGEGNISKAGVPLLSGIIVAIILGLFLTIVIYPFVPLLFSFLNPSSEVAELAVPYWRIRLFAMIFMGINYAFRGFFNGIHQPKYYMLSLIVIHILNVVFNYAFIYGHFGFSKMGTDGAALASALATVAGTIIYLCLGHFKLSDLNLFNELPKLVDIKKVFKLTIPSGIQQFMIAASMSSLFFIVGQLGIIQVAALNILINILMLCILPGFGFGMAAATLVGTSLGDKNQPQAKQYAYDVTVVGGAFTLIAGLIISFNAEAILPLFTPDVNIIQMAIMPLKITGALIFIDVMSVIIMNALLGSGDVAIVLKTSLISQWLFFFPIAAFSVFFFDFSFLFIWLLFIASRLGQGLIYSFYWQNNKWGKVKL